MNFPFLDFESSFFTNEELLFLAGASGGGVEHTIINNPATFTTDLAKPLRRLVIPFTPVQSGSGDPSPSNIRPITGWTGLNIYHSGEDTSNPDTIPVVFPALGKNLLKITLESGSSSGMEWTVSADGIITVGGTPTGAVQFTCGVAQLPTSGKVTVSGGYVAASNITWAQCSIKDEDGNIVGNVGNSDVGYFTFDIADYPGAKTIEVKIKRKSNNVQCSGEIKLQCETGTAATAFEPYTNTVYGGTLDALTGVLTVEWIAETKPFSEIKHSEGAGMKQGNLVFPEPIYVAGETGVQTKNICNIGIWSWSGITNTTPHFYTGYSNDVYKALVIVPLDMDESTSVTVAATLKTPRTVQLDPVTLSTLIGENVVWTDTNGDNTIVYLKKT